MIALCLCNNIILSLMEAPLKKKLADSKGATGLPYQHFFLEFPLTVNSRKLFGVLKREILTLTLKRILALSKLWFERLPAMCWT